MSIVKAFPQNINVAVALCKEYAIVECYYENWQEADNLLAAAGAEIIGTGTPLRDNVMMLPVRDLCNNDTNNVVEYMVTELYDSIGFYKTAAMIKGEFEMQDVCQSTTAYALEYLRNIHAETQWTTTDPTSFAKWYAATTL